VAAGERLGRERTYCQRQTCCGVVCRLSAPPRRLAPPPRSTRGACKGAEHTLTIITMAMAHGHGRRRARGAALPSRRDGTLRGAPPRSLPLLAAARRRLRHPRGARAAAAHRDQASPRSDAVYVRPRPQASWRRRSAWLSRRRSVNDLPLKLAMFDRSIAWFQNVRKTSACYSSLGALSANQPNHWLTNAPKPYSSSWLKPTNHWLFRTLGHGISTRQRRLFGGECKRPERAIAWWSELGGVATQGVRGL